MKVDTPFESTPAHSLPSPAGPLAYQTYASRDNFTCLLLGLIATVERIATQLPDVQAADWPLPPAGPADAPPELRAQSAAVLR